MPCHRSHYYSHSSHYSREPGVPGFQIPVSDRMISGISLLLLSALKRQAPTPTAKTGTGLPVWLVVVKPRPGCTINALLNDIHIVAITTMSRIITNIFSTTMCAGQVQRCRTIAERQQGRCIAKSVNHDMHFRCLLANPYQVGAINKIAHTPSVNNFGYNSTNTISVVHGCCDISRSKI